MDFKYKFSISPVFNTLGVYSFSKYFGVTGWRPGTIAIHENNIFYSLLKKMPDDKKDVLKRYAASWNDMKIH